MILYQEIVPTGILSRYVKCFWMIEGERGAHQHQEIVLPDGSMEMIFYNGNLPVEISPVQKKISGPAKSIIAGQILNHFEIMPQRWAGMLGIRFHPYGAFAFLQHPLYEFTESTITVEDFFGSAGRNLEQKVMEAKSLEQRIAALERFLLHCLSKRRFECVPVERCVHAIQHANGNISISQLAHVMNMYQRQLNRKFLDTVGISAKALARICRFQSALQWGREGKVENLTALAYAAGYYDQAHFIKDFKAFSGQNPRSFFSERHLFYHA